MSAGQRRFAAGFARLASTELTNRIEHAVPGRHLTEVADQYRLRDETID
jgi:hypothetical protein